MSDPIYGTFHDARTGQTITRELTPDEVAELKREPVDPVPIPEPE
jgi:hypothetical protein